MASFVAVPLTKLSFPQVTRGGSFISAISASF